MPQTINLKMTWKSALPMLLALVKDGNPEGQKAAQEELLRMADIADRFADFTEGDAEALNNPLEPFLPKE